MSARVWTDPETRFMNTSSMLVRSLTRACALGCAWAVACALEGCETTPKPADGGAKTQAATPAGSSQVRRLEANAGPRATAAAPKPTVSDPTAELLDEGSEVDDNVGQARVSKRAVEAARRPPGGDTAETGTGVGTGKLAVKSEEQRPEWAVLLVSFTEDDHRATAEGVRNAIIQRHPELRQAYVRSMGSGSAVLIGRFSGPSDPAAQAELRRVKEIGQGTPRPFARAMLTRVVSASAGGPVRPNDLRSVRQTRPKGTLYTLQVAAWATLGSKELTMADVKRSAEAYAQQLRTQGYEAYYFHDFGKETSTVTIGVFGPDAYDSRSTLYLPEVEQLMRKFPKSLLNGEEVLVDLDRARPGTKQVPQSSRLVEVPRF